MLPPFPVDALNEPPFVATFALMAIALFVVPLSDTLSGAEPAAIGALIARPPPFSLARRLRVGFVPVPLKVLPKSMLPAFPDKLSALIAEPLARISGPSALSVRLCPVGTDTLAVEA